MPDANKPYAVNKTLPLRCPKGCGTQTWTWEGMRQHCDRKHQHTLVRLPEELRDGGFNWMTQATAEFDAAVDRAAAKDREVQS